MNMNRKVVGKVIVLEKFANTEIEPDIYDGLELENGNWKIFHHTGWWEFPKDSCKWHISL